MAQRAARRVRQQKAETRRKNNASLARAVAAPPERESSSKHPWVDRETGLKLYEDMKLGREFENMTAQMYLRGKTFGFVHLYNGQEAVSTGCISALRKEDYICSTYRDHVHAISKGCEPKRVMAELFGRSTGICRGQGGSMHMFSKEHNVLGGYAFIGEGLPVALGSALQTAYRRRSMGEESADQVTVSFFGDGTCNNGAFYECLNMASLYSLPIVFAVENNMWAIGMEHRRATAPSMGDTEPCIWKKGPAFGMPGHLVDGMDVLAVREAADEAVERARSGNGPTLLELETYRYRGHSIADPDELRKEAEKNHFKQRDPIEQMKRVLSASELAGESDFKEIDDRVFSLLDEAVEFSDSSPFPERSQLLENVFPDPKGFGISPDGSYFHTHEGFTTGRLGV